MSVQEKCEEKSKENVDTDVRVKRVKRLLADRLRSSFCIINVQVGDGTTTVTLLASEFLKQVKPFIEEGVHAQIAVKSFRKAANLVSKTVQFFSPIAW